VRATAAADKHLEHAPLQKRPPCSALGSTGGAPLQERPPSLAEPQLLDVAAPLLLVFDTPALRILDNVLALEYIKEVLVSNEYFDAARPLIAADALHGIAAGDKLLLKKTRLFKGATLGDAAWLLVFTAVDARTWPWAIFSTSFSARPTTTSTAQHLDRAARRE